VKIFRKRIEPIKETQMVSLADIAFLIIFFFMLTSTFMSDKVSVSLPQLARSSKSEAPIQVIIDKEAHIYLNGSAIGGAEALETELMGLLRDRTSPRDCEVRLRCEKALTFKNYRGVYEAISHAGGVIAIMHDVKR